MKQNPLKEKPLPAGLGKILLAHLIPDAKNPRKDLKKGDPEFEKINKSVEKFGQLDPIIFNTRTRKVLGGHQRLKVLDSQGYTELFTVALGAYTWAFAEADLKELSEKEENAANIALNKAQGDWNIEQLTINLQELKLDDMLEFTGFDEKEFDQMLRELHKDDEPLDSEPQISRAEELRKEWGTELGQMWQCGDHRVICGDCTDPAVVARVMQGEKADMVFTDPPYNANYEGRGKNNLGKIQNDNLSNDSFDKFINAFIPSIKTNTKSGGVFYICCNWKDSYPRFFFALLTHGLTISANIVWNKGSGGMGWQDYRYQYEFIIYAISEGHKWYGGRTETDIWDFNRASTAKYTHPTQKPIDLPIKAITNSSKGDDVVLDPFLGSGTTMIACENLGRKCRGCEIDPGYVAVILQRYKDTFKKEPVLME